MALTKRQLNFIDHYIITGNASKAAEKAGYSAHSAGRQGHRLLSDVQISKQIELKHQEMSKKLNMEAAEIYGGLCKLARESEKDGDKIQAHKILAQIKGMLKENVTNVAIFSNMEAEDKSIVSKRLAHKDLSKDGAGAGNH